MQNTNCHIAARLRLPLFRAARMTHSARGTVCTRAIDRLAFSLRHRCLTRYQTSIRVMFAHVAARTRAAGTSANLQSGLSFWTIQLFLHDCDCAQSVPCRLTYLSCPGRERCASPFVNCARLSKFWLWYSKFAFSLRILLDYRSL